MINKCIKRLLFHKKHLRVKTEFSNFIYVIPLKKNIDGCDIRHKHIIFEQVNTRGHQTAHFPFIR